MQKFRALSQKLSEILTCIFASVLNFYIGPNSKQQNGVSINSFIDIRTWVLSTPLELFYLFQMPNWVGLTFYNKPLEIGLNYGVISTAIYFIYHMEKYVLDSLLKVLTLWKIPTFIGRGGGGL